jgi:hypothetical protein
VCAISGTTQLVIPQSVYNNLTAGLLAIPAFVSAFGSDFFTQSNCIATKDGSTMQQLNANLPTMTIVLGNSTDGGNVTLTLPPVSSYLAVSHSLLSLAPRACLCPCSPACFLLRTRVRPLVLICYIGPDTSTLVVWSCARVVVWWCAALLLLC